MDIAKGVSNTAAILIEPMQGSSGYIIPPRGYLNPTPRVLQEIRNTVDR